MGTLRRGGLEDFLEEMRARWKGKWEWKGRMERERHSAEKTAEVRGARGESCMVLVDSPKSLVSLKQRKF